MSYALPILSCYFDVSDNSFALLTDTNELLFRNFPYIYSSEVFSNQCNEETFNKSLIECVLKEFSLKTKKKLNNIEIISTGFLESPRIGLESKLTSKLISLLQDTEDIFPFIINDFSVMTKDAFLSYEVCNKKEQGIEEGESNELANLAIYPQLIPTDLPTKTVLDRYLSEKIGGLDLGYPQSGVLTFSGSRFSRPKDIYEYLDWILILDLIKKPGIYTIYIDRKNYIPLSLLLKRYKSDFIFEYKEHLEQIGTLINSPGDTECLLISDLDTKQFFDIKKDSFYQIPVSSDSIVKAKIKNGTLGSFEKNILGGRVGLMVDTRDKKYTISSQPRYFNSCVRQLSLCTPQY